MSAPDPETLLLAAVLLAQKAQAGEDVTDATARLAELASGEEEEGEEDDDLSRFAEAVGFTGEYTDSIGRRRCYQDGKPVPCKQIEHLMKGSRSPAAKAAPAGKGSAKAAPAPAGKAPAAKAGKAAPADQGRFTPDPGLHPRALEALKGMAAGLKASPGLTPARRKEYAEAAQEVLSRMPPRALDRFRAGQSEPPLFVPSIDAVNPALAGIFAGMPKVVAKLKAGVKLGAAYLSGGGVSGRLVLDGGDIWSAASVYAHEFGHAVDGPKKELSSSPAWQDAFAAELRGGQLNRYSGTSPAEGFAEFGRLLYGGQWTAEGVRKKFPRCFAYWQKQGLVPAPGSSSFAEADEPSLPDIFSERIDLPDGGHADALLDPPDGPA